jgi:hypothetical protein
MFFFFKPKPMGGGEVIVGGGRYTQLLVLYLWQLYVRILVLDNANADLTPSESYFAWAWCSESDDSILYSE